MPFGIVLVDCKSPGVAVFAVVKGDLFPDVGGADQSLSCRIPTQRKVIQFVRRWSGLFPYAHTEAAGYWGTPRIHYFRPVAVPRGIPLINRRAVGDELHLPEAHDSGVVGVVVPIATVARHQYKRRTSEFALGLAGFLLWAGRRCRCLGR